VSRVVTNEEKTYVNLHRTVPLTLDRRSTASTEQIKKSGERQWRENRDAEGAEWGVEWGLGMGYCSPPQPTIGGLRERRELPTAGSGPQGIAPAINAFWNRTPLV